MEHIGMALMRAQLATTSHLSPTLRYFRFGTANASGGLRGLPGNFSVVYPSSRPSEF